MNLMGQKVAKQSLYRVLIEAGSVFMGASFTGHLAWRVDTGGTQMGVER